MSDKQYGFLSFMSDTDVRIVITRSINFADTTCNDNHKTGHLKYRKDLCQVMEEGGCYTNFPVCREEFSKLVCSFSRVDPRQPWLMANFLKLMRSLQASLVSLPSFLHTFYILLKICLIKSSDH